MLIGRGSSDPWYSEEKLESDLEILRSLGCEADVVRFSAGHEWTAEFRSHCQRFLASLAAAA